MSEYVVEETAHGVMVRGSVPVSDLTTLMRMWSERGLTSVVMGIPGATLAVARPGVEDAWRAEVDAKAAREAGGDRELMWLRGSDTGISSQTIFSVLSERWGQAALTGSFGPSTPSDPSDFGRCYRLLKAIPEWRPRLHEVVAVYPEWGPLVREWPFCEALFDDEAPTGRCPRLYAVMQRLLREGGAR